MMHMPHSPCIRRKTGQLDNSSPALVIRQYSTPRKTGCDSVPFGTGEARVAFASRLQCNSRGKRNTDKIVRSHKAINPYHIENCSSDPDMGVVGVPLPTWAVLEFRAVVTNVSARKTWTMALLSLEERVCRSLSVYKSWRCDGVTATRLSSRDWRHCCFMSPECFGRSPVVVKPRTNVQKERPERMERLIITKCSGLNRPRDSAFRQHRVALQSSLLHFSAIFFHKY